MTPVDILSYQLDKYERNIKKSKHALEHSQITLELHRIHKTNNEPKIEELQRAIDVLLANGFIKTNNNG
jgi:hypothetical protein